MSEMPTKQKADRLTWRQLRLLDWMQNPAHPDLPTGPAITYQKALWKVSDLVRLSGVCEDYNHAKCLHDLKELSSRDLVTLIQNDFGVDRWILGNPWG